MWPPAGTDPDPELFFDRDTKCCTYTPELANFLVGRILDDADPALTPGRSSVERRIDARIGVTPLGLMRPPAQALLYRQSMPAGFGHAVSLRCPHYLADAGGACGIWRHRNAVCSTWFCKYGRGATGQRFWQALEQLLVIVERNLSRWCLLELGVDAATLALLLPRGSDRGHEAPHLDAAGVDGDVSEASYQALWGAWQGRERELYRRASGLVDGLRWADVVRIGGVTVEALGRIVVDAHHRHGDDTVPARLAVGGFSVVATGRERMRVASYSDYDPLELPRLLVDVLPYFDGRPTAEALRRIRAERNVNVQPDLLRRLVDFGILVERG
jgi:hypothetical protein